VAAREAHFHFMQNEQCEVEQLGDKSQKEARTVTFAILGNSATISLLNLPKLSTPLTATHNFLQSMQLLAY
jgi:hypothetical protein